MSVSGGESTDLWEWLAGEERARNRRVRLRARFKADANVETPIALLLREGEPRVELSPQAKALFQHINPKEVAERHADKLAGARWLEAFRAALREELLTPNQVCRLLLGPHYRPNRTI